MESILGQSGAVGFLQSVLASGRLQHAFVFAGPQGVGKFTTACRFGRVLLCLEPQNSPAGWVTACGACRSCRLFGDPSQGGVGAPGDRAHPDFHVITKELARFSDDATVRARKLTSIPVTVLRRSLIEPVYRSPQIGRRKVFVVDEAHLLNDTGQNLLLKTLEQPPPDTYLILVTDRVNSLLATIRSRCQHLAFVPVPDEVVAENLDRLAPGTSDDQRRWLVRFAEGSLGRVKLAVAYDLFDWAQTLLPALDQMHSGVFPHDLGQTMAQQIDTFAKQWVDRHTGASKEAAVREGAVMVWSVIGQHARAKMVEVSTGLPAGDPAAAEQLLAPWLGVVDALGIAQRQLASNVNLALTCDHLVSLMQRALAPAGVTV